MVLRFRPAIWTPSLECYLAELLVRAQRGRGLCRALKLAVLDAARTEDADYIGVNSSEDGHAARGPEREPRVHEPRTPA